MPDNPSSDTFSWAGSLDGAWNDPANWVDLTTGDHPATVAPAAGSTAIINGPTDGTVFNIESLGAAGTLDISGGVLFTLGSSITTDVLNLTTANAALTVEGSFSVGTLVETGAGAAIDALGSDATLSIGAMGPVTQMISASNNGFVLLPDQVTLAGGTLYAGLPDSTVQIGGSGNAGFYGAFVDTGATLSGSGVVEAGYILSSSGLAISSDFDLFGVVDATSITVLSPLVGLGTVNVADHGYFSASLEEPSGNSTLTFNIGAFGTIELATRIVNGDAINFVGSDGLAEFEYDLHTPGDFLPKPDTEISEQSPISGFAQGDRLFGVVAALDGFGAAQYVQNGAIGTLAVAASDGSANGPVSVVFQGTYTTGDFLVTVVPNATQYTGSAVVVFQVDLLPATSYAASLGSGMGDSYSYTGASGGAWGDAANWYDVTKAAAATVAPGAGDHATITGATGALYTVITEIGSAGTTSITGNVAIEGQVAAGMLQPGAGGDLLVTNGGTLTATSLDETTSGASVIAYGNAPSSAGGYLDVTGGATLGAGASLTAAGGGRVQVADLTILGGITGYNSVVVSSYESNGTLAAGANNSAITVGTSNDAAAGTVKIDAGAAITDLSPAGNGARIAAQVTNDGLLTATNLSINGLGGDGTVVVAAGGTLTTSTLTADASDSFHVGAGALLVIGGNVPTVNPIAAESFTLSGQNDQLYFDVGGSLGNLFVTAPITGFGDGASVEFELDLYPTFALNPIFSAAFTPTSASGGTLGLFDTSGTEVGSLDLLGSYSGDSFVVTQDSDYNANIVEAEPGSFGLSPGSGVGDSFTYTGISGGAWGDAANWTDSTDPLLRIAPGAGDTVSVTGTASNGLTVLTGSGAAGSLSLSGDVAVAGSVAATTLGLGAGTLSDSLLVDAHGTLLAQTLSAFAFDLQSVFVDGPGAVLQIGTMQGYDFNEFYNSGAFTAANGGYLSVGGDSLIYFDAANTPYPFIESNGGTIALSGAASGTAAVDMLGGGNLLEFSSPGAGSLDILPAIIGFTVSDTIEVTFASSASSVSFIGNSTVSGVLDLLNGGGSVIGTLTLDGDFNSDTFYSAALSPTVTEIALTPLCYLRGTHILTPAGNVPVEALRIGDAVITRFGGYQRIKWIGRQSYAARFLRHNREQVPVRIRAGAFGPGLPVRDLSVSPGHSMLLGEVLVLAKHLVNGVTVTQDAPPDEVHYYQLEFGRHDCVLAEGVWSESFADYAGLRNQFHNVAEFWRLYPEHETPAAHSMCAPRPDAGPALQAALRPLAARAAASAAPGLLQGWVDEARCDGAISGWARDTGQPGLPVLLEIRLHERLLGTVLACDARADLDAAGLGRCAFAFSGPAIPRGALNALRVRRAGGGTLAMTPECLVASGLAAPVSARRRRA